MEDLAFRLRPGSLWREQKVSRLPRAGLAIPGKPDRGNFGIRSDVNDRFLGLFLLRSARNCCVQSLIINDLVQLRGDQ